MCSENFSTTGTRISPIKLSLMPRFSTIHWGVVRTVSIVRGMRRMTYFDLLHQEHGHEGDKGDTDDDSEDRLREGEFVFEQVLVPIMVLLLVGFQNVLVQAVVRSYLEPQVYAESHQQHNSRDA